MAANEPVPTRSHSSMPFTSDWRQVIRGEGGENGQKKRREEEEERREKRTIRTNKVSKNRHYVAKERLTTMTHRCLLQLVFNSAVEGPGEREKGRKGEGK